MASRPFLRHYLPFLLTRADTLLSRALMSEIEARGLSAAEWRILSTLSDADGASIGEIAELVILPQPTVSRWVDRLAGRGLVVRSIGVGDRRVTIVSITDDGHRLAGELIELASRTLDATTSSIPQRELDQLEVALLRLIDRLGG